MLSDFDSDSALNSIGALASKIAAADLPSATRLVCVRHLEAAQRCALGGDAAGCASRIDAVAKAVEAHGADAAVVGALRKAFAGGGRPVPAMSDVAKIATGALRK